MKHVCKRNVLLVNLFRAQPPHDLYRRPGPPIFCHPALCNSRDSKKKAIQLRDGPLRESKKSILENVRRYTRD